MGLLTTTCFALAVQGAGGWTPVGDPRAVTIVDTHSVTIATPEKATAGALLAVSTPRAGALLVTADVEPCAAGDLAFSLNDADSGVSIGQFRNPLPITAKSTVVAALSTGGGGLMRLFVGAHDRKTRLVMSSIRQCAVNAQRVSSCTSLGALVGDSRVAGQSFVAAGDRCEAVEIRIRQLNENTGGPDLCVRLFAIRPDGAIDRSTPLGMTVIRRSQVPPAEMDAARALTIPLPARVARGQKYFVEFSSVAPCDASQAYLLLGGPDAYPQGERFENGNAKPDSDLCLTIYEAHK